MKDQIKHYKDTGKLPSHPHVFCSCGNKTTMFGTNLESRIKQFGSLEKLLKEFKCRDCRNVGKPIKPPRFKRVKKKKKVLEKDENQRYDIPIFKNVRPEPINLLEDRKACMELTTNQCWRPDIYLNGSRTCDKCALYPNCNSRLKRLARSLVR